MSNMQKQRSPWLDNAKMVAMLCVIAGHIGGLFCGWPYNIGGLIVAFNMPLFVLLSGYTALGGLLRLENIKSLLDYAEKTLWRMVIPAVCLSAIDQAWRGLILSRKLWILYAILAIALWLIGKWKDKEIKHIPCRIVDLARALLVVFLLCSSLKLNMYWFLSMLMTLQMTAAIMILAGRWMKTSDRYLIPIISALLWLFSYFAYNSWTFEMSIYFSMGLVMKQLGLFDKTLQMKQWVAGCLFLIGCILCCLFTINYGFYYNGINEMISQGLYHIYPLRVLIALFLSLAIIRWVYALSHSYSWFSKMGSYTLAFYTIHSLILDDFLKPYIHFDNPANYMWIFGILATIALTAVTYFIIRVWERWVVTRRLVLGILK